MYERSVGPCVRKVHGENKIKEIRILLGCYRPDPIRISTTTSPNLQDVLIGLDATSKVQTEIRRGQFDSTGCSDGRPGLLW